MAWERWRKASVEGKGSEEGFLFLDSHGRNSCGGFFFSSHSLRQELLRFSCGSEIFFTSGESLLEIGCCGSSHKQLHFDHSVHTSIAL